MVAAIHKITQLAWSEETLYPIEVTGIRTIMVQHSRCLYLCHTIYPGNSVCPVLGLCTAARTSPSRHHCCLLSAFIHTFIHSWKDTGIPQSSVCSLKCFAMSNSVKRISLSLFYHSDPIISIAESIHEMHVDTFICKCVMHYSHLTILQHNTIHSH